MPLGLYAKGACSPLIFCQRDFRVHARAERVGFEPTVVLRLHRFSRPTDSATLAPLQSSRVSVEFLLASLLTGKNKGEARKKIALQTQGSVL
ncbi:MAG: hypothetical protein CMR00_08650 [[Chlorobium] sp. 445]|nr:MAG: hypothetical protein CMR00_08650 [[Chlorobium] sp. 445]